MNHGTKPERLRRKDYDYIKSYHPQIYAGTASYPKFPPEYLTDKTEWLPNQNEDGLPFACTSYSSTKLARILGVDANVLTLEAITNSNKLGGFGVLASIDAARKSLGWFGWRFTIQATGILDNFDAFRLAQVSGLPETRAISWGTPWFPSWENAALNGHKIMAMPTDEELQNIRTNINAYSWHDHVLDGWSQYFPVSPGQLLYRDGSHQGPNVDYLYFPRDVINVVQNLYGTIAVTGTAATPPAIARVPLPDWFWSLWHSWFGLSY
jgi:hypothetical protein